jgi:hypothetical protein
MNGYLASGLIALTVLILGLIFIWLTPDDSTERRSQTDGHRRTK